MKILVYFKNTKIIINGDVRTHSNPLGIIHKTQSTKKDKVVLIFILVLHGILKKMKLLCVQKGRCVRPLYIVEKTILD
jgi:hypothetical protein